MAWRSARVAFIPKPGKLHYTHSLTHCCAWPAEGRSVLHIERSWPAIQAAPTDRPVSSSNCCSQFLCGRPVGRFQSAVGGVGGVPVCQQREECRCVARSEVARSSEMENSSKLLKKCVLGYWTWWWVQTIAACRQSHGTPRLALSEGWR